MIRKLILGFVFCWQCFRKCFLTETSLLKAQEGRWWYLLMGSRCAGLHSCFNRQHHGGSYQVEAIPSVKWNRFEDLLFDDVLCSGREVKRSSSMVGQTEHKPDKRTPAGWFQFTRSRWWATALSINSWAHWKAAFESDCNALLDNALISRILLPSTNVRLLNLRHLTVKETVPWKYIRGLPIRRILSGIG